MRSSTVLAGLAAGALALTGCGDKTVKTDELKASIAEQFKAQGIPLTDVRCPEDIKAEKDAPIRCTAKNEAGTTLVIEGSVTSVDGDKARFDVRANRGIAKGTAIAQQAQRILEQQVGQKAKGMTCPAQVPIPTTPSVTCELQTLDGKRYDATVTISKDAKLNVKVAPQPKD